MLTENLPVYRVTHNLIVHIVSCTKNFPKDYKYSLGERLKDEIFNIILLVYRANSSYSKHDRKVAIKDCLEKIKSVVIWDFSNDVIVGI